MDIPELLVLRHGETVWNREGRLQGGLDSPLTDTGAAHASQQRDILAAVGVSDWDWVSSPQGRAVHTAEIALDAPANRIRTDRRLAEIGMGRWSGRRRADVAAEVPHLFKGESLDWYDHAPEGEGIAALAIRVGDFLAEVRRPTVIVTHGITSRVLRCLALGRPADQFHAVGGGQGIVYHIANGQSRYLPAPPEGKESLAV